MNKISNIFQDIYNNICFLISLLILLTFVLWAGIGLGYALEHKLIELFNPTALMLCMSLAQFLLFFIYWEKNRKTKEETPTQNEPGHV